MFARLTTLILDHARTAAVLLATLVILVAAGGRLLEFDFNVARFFAANDPATGHLQEHLARWNEENLLVLVVDGGDGTLLTRERLQRLDEIRDALDELSIVAEVTAPSSVYADVTPSPFGFQFRPLLDTVPPDEEALPKWRESILADDRFTPTFFSSDGKRGAILVRLNVDADDLFAMRGAMEEIRGLLGRFNGKEGLSYAPAGMPAIRGGLLNAMFADQFLLAPLAILLVTLLLLVLFGSLHGLVIPGIAATVPMGMLLGGMGYAGESIGLLNQIYLVLIPVIASADAIHLIARFHEENGDRVEEDSPNTGRREAVVRTMQHMGVACFLTSFTTIVGFMSLNMTQLLVLRRFGTYAAVGVLLAYLTVLFIIPLSLNLTRRSKRQGSSGRDALTGFLTRGARWSMGHPVLILVLAGAVTLGAGMAGAQVRVDYRLTGIFDPGHPVAVANTQVEDHLGGLLILEFDLAGTAGAFDDPKVITALGEAEGRLAAHPKVKVVLGLGRLLAWTNRTFGNHEGAGDAAIARLMLLAQQSGTLGEFVTPGRDHARMVVWMEDVGAADLIDLAERFKAQTDNLLNPLGVSVHPTGNLLMAYRGLAQVSSDLRDSLLSATLVIALTIAVLFRSLPIGLLSLVPNLIPLIIGYGVLGFLGWSLDPAPAVVFCVALGLVVDSSIHILVRFREEHRKGWDVTQAVERAIRSAGRAVAMTSVILTGGMGVIALSAFPANATFGTLGAIITIVALICDLFVLPALLVIFYGRKVRTP